MGLDFTVFASSPTENPADAGCSRANTRGFHQSLELFSLLHWLIRVFMARWNRRRSSRVWFQ
jgi:hypothetical protein